MTNLQSHEGTEWLNWDIQDMSEDMLFTYQEELDYLSNHETIEGDDLALNSTAANLSKYTFGELVFHYQDFKKYSKEVECELEVYTAAEIYKQELIARANNNKLLKLRLPIELLFIELPPNG